MCKNKRPKKMGGENPPIWSCEVRILAYRALQRNNFHARNAGDQRKRLSSQPKSQACETSIFVYGWRGASSTSITRPDSTISPSFITITSWAIARITSTSWVMSR